MTPLIRLIEALDEASDLPEVFPPALETIAEALAVERAAILLCDAEGVLRVRAFRGLSEEHRLALEGRPFWEGAATPAPVLVEDLADTNAPARERTLHAHAGVRGFCAIPVRSQSRLLGALGLFADAPRRFSERDLELGRAVAAHIAGAIARFSALEAERRSRQEAEQSADRMQRLVRVATKLSAALTPPEVAQVIVEEGAAAVGTTKGGVWLTDASGARIELLLSRGYAPEMNARFAAYALDADNPLCHAIRAGEPICLESWEEYTARYPASAARVSGLPTPLPVAFICLPLRVEENVIGGLAFTFFEPHTFDDDERAFLGLLARHCAQGLERARLYQRALEAVRVRDDFLSVAGHELRTPLGTLLMQAQLLDRTLDGGPPAALKDRSVRVLRSIVRLTKLADDLLDVGRISAGRLRLELEEVELSGLVRDVVARSSETTSGAGTEVRMEVDGPIAGRWDRLRLEQVITNLLTNAYKYGGSKPIEVHVRHGAEGAELTVRDQGIGIAPSDQPRIFERFERAAGSRHFTGLGLGLWIAREIVHAHGGRISVKSALGQGAEFHVVLPLSPP